MNVRNLLAFCLLSISTHSLRQQWPTPTPNTLLSPVRQLDLSGAMDKAKSASKDLSAEPKPSTDTFIEASSAGIGMDSTDQTLAMINMNIRSEIMGKIHDMIGGLDQRLKDMRTNFNEKIQRIHSGINSKVDVMVKNIKEKAQHLQNSNKV